MHCPTRVRRYDTREMDFTALATDLTYDGGVFENNKIKYIYSEARDKVSRYHSKEYLPVSRGVDFRFQPNCVSLLVS